MENHIRRNLMISNYNSKVPLDHDDGSRFYQDEHNVFLFGGTKNFMGAHKNVSDNLYIYPEHISTLDGHYFTGPSTTHKLGAIQRLPYCAESLATDVTQFSGYHDSWVNNTCVVSDALIHPYYFDPDPCGGNKSFPRLSSNRFLAPKGHQLEFPVCNSTGQKGFSLEAWKGNRNWDGSETDGGTVIGVTPSDSELESTIRMVLQF